MFSEKEKLKIQKEAREILDKFGKALDKVEEVEKSRIDKSESYREEKDGEKSDENFRKRMFKNAPRKNDEFIIAEKSSW